MDDPNIQYAIEFPNSNSNLNPKLTKYQFRANQLFNNQNANNQPGNKTKTKKRKKKKKKRPISMDIRCTENTSLPVQNTMKPQSHQLLLPHHDAKGNIINHPMMHMHSESQRKVIKVNNSIEEQGTIFFPSLKKHNNQEVIYIRKEKDETIQKSISVTNEINDKSRKKDEPDKMIAKTHREFKPDPLAMINEFDSKPADNSTTINNDNNSNFKANDELHNVLPEILQKASIINLNIHSGSSTKRKRKKKKKKTVTQLNNPSTNKPNINATDANVPIENKKLKLNNSSISLSCFSFYIDRTINDQHLLIQNKRIELNQLNDQIVKLATESTSQRTQLKKLNTIIANHINNINTRQHCHCSSRNQIKVLKNSKSVDMQILQLHNAKQTISILTKDKTRFQHLIQFPNLKFIQFKSQGLTNQINDLLLIAKKLKLERGEHLKCPREYSELESEYTFAFSQLKQLTLTNDSMIKKIEKAGNDYVKKSIECPTAYPVNANSNIMHNGSKAYLSSHPLKKSASGLCSISASNRVMQYPLAMAIFSNKEIRVLQEVFKSNVSDYYKLMKTISLTESLTNSKEIIHSQLIKKYRDQMNDFEAKIANEEKRKNEGLEKENRLMAQVADFEKSNKALTNKVNELTISINTMRELINDKQKEIDSLHVVIKDIRDYEMKMIHTKVNTD